MAISKSYRRERIKKRIRKVVSGDAASPRMSVFRSNRDIYVQFIDDTTGKTLASASSKIKEISGQQSNKSDKARMVGKLAAEKAMAAGIKVVKFDRNGYLYHGRVKALAEGAREGGLQF
jgi:large subunit ribosomal protein L18